MGLSTLKTDLSNDQLAANQGNLIRYCKNKDELGTIISRALFEAIDLYSKEVSQNSVFVMVADLIEDYQADPVEVIINVVKKIRKGHIKIYGKVTPFDLRELVKTELEDIVIIKENSHHDNKGYGSQDMTPRTSGRLSDHFDKNKLQKRFKNK